MLGLATGAGVVVATHVGLWFVVYWGARAFDRDPDFTLLGWTVRASPPILLALGTWYWLRARTLDERNFMSEKATPLPLALVQPFDDVWVEAVLECPDPVVPPHFDVKCVYYKLEEQELVRHGRSRAAPASAALEEPSWSAPRVLEERHAGRAWLCDGGDRLALALSEARYEFPAEATLEEGKRRYLLHHVPACARVSACGFVADFRPSRGKEVRPLSRRERRAIRQRPRTARTYTEPTLAPGDGLPLILTPRPRLDWWDRAEAEEAKHRAAATVILFLGTSGCLWSGARLLGAGAVPYGWCALAAALLLSPLAAIHLYNRFALFRVRVAATWGHLEADLKMRHDLIPALVAVVNAHGVHERWFFESVVGPSVEREMAADRDAARLMALRERIPALTADESFARLARQLVALEDKIAHGRSFYNEAVTEHNAYLERFPQLLLARAAGFKPAPYWKSDAAASRQEVNPSSPP